MDREGHDNVSFFTGIEVEHTPAYGKKTLFVVGVQTVEDIALNLSRADGIEHIYFGANQSFPNPTVFDFTTWNQWQDMITPFLKRGYFCTLDIDVASVEGLAEGHLCEYNNFIPMLSVKVPYVRLLNYNATLKIDDKDFDSTNPGVWCHSVHALMDRKVFTDWTQYTKDLPL
jgi:hypothetical protein